MKDQNAASCPAEPFVIGTCRQSHVVPVVARELPRWQHPRVVRRSMSAGLSACVPWSVLGHQHVLLRNVAAAHGANQE